MRRTLIKYSHEKYASADYWNLRREYGETPNGNPIDGKWVLRNDKGEWIDFGTYRNDIADRNDLILDESGLYG